MQFFNFIYLFLEIGEGKEEERERNIHVREKQLSWLVAPHTPPTGALAHNPGMCPDGGWNRWPFSSLAGAQSTVPHQLGQKMQFLKKWLFWWYIPFKLFFSDTLYNQIKLFLFSLKQILVSPPTPAFPPLPLIHGSGVLPVSPHFTLSLFFLTVPPEGCWFPKQCLYIAGHMPSTSVYVLGVRQSQVSPFHLLITGSPFVYRPVLLFLDLSRPLLPLSKDGKELYCREHVQPARQWTPAKENVPTFLSHVYEDIYDVDLHLCYFSL